MEIHGHTGIQQNNNEATDGKPVQGAQGGLHGKDCECTKVGIGDLATWREEVPLRHKPKTPERAPDGKPGILADQHPIPQQPLEVNLCIEKYKNYYEQEAKKPDVCSFISVFPSLK